MIGAAGAGDDAERGSAPRTLAVCYGVTLPK